MQLSAECSVFKGLPQGSFGGERGNDGTLLGDRTERTGTVVHLLLHYTLPLYQVGAMFSIIIRNVAKD